MKIMQKERKFGLKPFSKQFIRWQKVHFHYDNVPWQTNFEI